MVFSANFLLPTLPLLNISSQLENTHNNDFFNGFSLSVINQNKQWGSLKGLSAEHDEGRRLCFILLLESTESILEIPYGGESRRGTEHIKDPRPNIMVVFLPCSGFIHVPQHLPVRGRILFLPSSRSCRESPSDKDEEIKTLLS